MGAIFVNVAGFIQHRNVCFTTTYKATKPPIETKKDKYN
jgi:hypothetical protein